MDKEGRKVRKRKWSSRVENIKENWELSTMWKRWKDNHLGKHFEEINGCRKVNVPEKRKK